METNIYEKVQDLRKAYPNGEFFKRVKDLKSLGYTLAQAIEEIEKINATWKAIPADFFKP